MSLIDLLIWVGVLAIVDYRRMVCTESGAVAAADPADHHCGVRDHCRDCRDYHASQSRPYDFASDRWLVSAVR